MFQIINYIEAGFWIVIGAGLLIRGIALHGRNRGLCLSSAVVFVLFGASDLARIIHTS